MLTLVLAYINARFKCDYQMLFLGTFLLDLALIQGITLTIGSILS